MKCTVTRLPHHMYLIDGVEMDEHRYYAYISQFPTGSRLIVDGALHEIKRDQYGAYTDKIEHSMYASDYLLPVGFVLLAVACGIGFLMACA